MLQLAVERAEFNESDCKLLSEAHREIISPLMVPHWPTLMRTSGGQVASKLLTILIIRLLGMVPKCELLIPLQMSQQSAIANASDFPKVENLRVKAQIKFNLCVSLEINGIAERLLTAVSNQLSLARSPECKVLLWSRFVHL